MIQRRSILVAVAVTFVLGCAERTEPKKELETAAGDFLAHPDVVTERNSAGEVIGLFVPDQHISVEALALHTALEELTLASTTCEGNLNEALHQMPHLRELSVMRVDLPADFLEGVRLPTLAALDLRGTRGMTTAIAKRIGGLTSLEQLVLTGTRLDNAGAAALNALTKLEQLCLVRTDIDDEALASIGELTQLRERSLEACHITDAGLERIQHLSELRLLTIHNTLVTERGLQFLKNLQELETLYFCRHVSAAGAASLRHLQSLKHLYIGDYIDAAGRETLSAELDVAVY